MPIYDTILSAILYDTFITFRLCSDLVLTKIVIRDDYVCIVSVITTLTH